MTTTGVSRPMGRNDHFPMHLAPEPRADSPGRNDARSPYRTTISHFDDTSDEEDSLEEPQQELRAPTNSTNPNIPLHPIASMQDAFAESLEEATTGGLDQKPKLSVLDAKARREKLLSEDKSEGPPNRLWRFRPGQKCHELRKLLAQISFGVYLLINGMANSNTQVLAILQGHIDEVDEFLETALEDIRRATEDLNDRLDLLKLPMENMETFEQMLENRKFRLQIVEGNVNIEHILSRTSTAHTQTIRDISEGLRSTKQFSRYLNDNEKGRWRQQQPDVVDVFEAMKGNTEGWHNAFTALESQSKRLSGLLVRLSTTIVEIDKKAGEVSRRTRFTLEPYSDPDGRPVPRSPESPTQATPPPSPPKNKADVPPRIKTLYFGAPMCSLLEAPESPVFLGFPAQLDKRMTTDSDTMREILPASQYTPPESSKRIPEVVVEQGGEVEEEIQQIVSNDHHSESLARENEEDHDKEDRNEEEDEDDDEDDEDDEDKAGEDDKDDNALFILQPRTYTPVPPAPLPSPRVLAAPRPTPEEISIHIEVDEEDDRHSEEGLRESAIIIPQQNLRPTTSPGPHRQQLQLNQRQPSEPQEPGAGLSHKTSLRDRVSLKIELPRAIHVPPANAMEFQHARYPTPQDTPLESPRGQQPSGHHVYGSELGPHTKYDASKRYNGNIDFAPPAFPNLIPSPASEHQYFRPVQASPHSPLQQRPHTAGTVVNRPGYHQRNAPSQMGMSMLSNVTTMTQDTSATSRTIKKKRSAFGWLKKAFSLDEEERAAFEERRRQQPVDHYRDGRSPRYLDGKRVDRPQTSRPPTGRTYT
ncbi:hypothetical protein VP1G_04397 [Cytospora mali]|uniref:Uncharacterized protein n=1 Tax=Cytospora mali TaxID=578113 RepID=A0A194UZG9_CYTMA|nr:hypothetical protein VP1G_04397 [Valsa mali var. pyri (nom. inval.)]